MEKLKPCPFCGAIPVIKCSHKLGIYSISAKHDVSCVFRQTGEARYFNKDELVSEWNRRTPE